MMLYYTRRMSHAAALALLLASMGHAQTPREWRRVSPFTDVRIEENNLVRVEYDGKTFELISVEDVTTADLLAFCRKTYADKWLERFATDLADVLADMGKKSGDTVKLVLRNPAENADRIIERAELTEANRQKVRRAVEARLTVPAFRAALEKRWSYLPLSKIDLPRAVDRLQIRVDMGIRPGELALEMQRIIAQGIDGHAGVAGWEREIPPGYTPFLVEPVGNRYVAFAPDRSALLDGEHPFIESIDGRTIPDWIDVASAFVPDGSRQYVRREGLRLLRSIQFLRAQLNFAPADSVPISLVSADGTKRIVRQVRIVSKSPVYGIWPREEFKPRLPEGIAYVRLARMREGMDLRKTIADARDAKGLILDVRDNSGGSREGLRELAACLLKPGSAPRVVNVAAQRLHPDHDAERMATRFLYPADWDGWSPAEREAIAALRKTFRPERELPQGAFGDWHYTVLSPSPDGPHFDKPVVVLMNGKCFSATDVFLSALKGVSNVTLVGTPSSGGSANADTIELGGSSIRVRLGTMVSFQSSGQLFDTRGVEPDVLVEPDPRFFLSDGPDLQLDRAVEILTAADAKGS